MSMIIPRILDKLGQVRSRGLRSFGSEKHQFELNPPLTEEYVQQFEKREAAQLPLGYRDFLLQAGNGGAGPYYGLLALEKWPEASQDEIPGCLSRRCVLVPEMPEGLGWGYAQKCPPDVMLDGTLTLTHQGCTFYALLIVTGEFRGRVVYIDLQQSRPPYFLHDPDFLSWYERWLDELLGGYDDSWFGFGLPGREEQLLEVINDRRTSPDLMCEALRTLARIPQLLPATLASLRRLLRHSASEVRQRAVHLIGQHLAVEALEDIKSLMQDESSLVRRNALEALARLPEVVWESMARESLRSDGPELVLKAMFLLKNAGLLRPEDIQIMCASANPEIRRYGEWADGHRSAAWNLPPAPWRRS